jgi:hypothetical protein
LCKFEVRLEPTDHLLASEWCRQPLNPAIVEEAMKNPAPG